MCVSVYILQVGYITWAADTRAVELLFFMMRALVLRVSVLRVSANLFHVCLTTSGVVLDVCEE